MGKDKVAQDTRTTAEILAEDEKNFRDLCGKIDKEMVAAMAKRVDETMAGQVSKKLAEVEAMLSPGTRPTADVPWLAGPNWTEEAMADALHKVKCAGASDALEIAAGLLGLDPKDSDCLVAKFCQDLRAYQANRAPLSFWHVVRFILQWEASHTGTRIDVNKKASRRRDPVLGVDTMTTATTLPAMLNCDCGNDEPKLRPRGDGGFYVSCGRCARAGSKAIDEQKAITMWNAEVTMRKEGVMYS